MADIFKVHDRVFDYMYGWGTVLETNKGEIDVLVLFEEMGVYSTYTRCGRWSCDTKPVLSFTEYTLDGFSQKRPSKPINFEVNDCVYHCNYGYGAVVEVREGVSTLDEVVVFFGERRIVFSQFNETLKKVNKI